MLRILFLITASLSLASGVEIRLWTDLQERKIEAVWVKTEGKNVTLRLNDGREVSYMVEKLSAVDRKYIDGISGHPSLAKAMDFDAAWPERVTFAEDPEIKTIEESAEKKRFVYESANYSYVCDVRLSQSVVKGFAGIFEATHLFCRSLPLRLNGGNQAGEKHAILLFEQYEDYIKAGGLPNSAGVFASDRQVVMVPLMSLGLRPVGSGYMLDRHRSSITLSHELTHQLTPECYFQKGALGWFSEGLAEYVATTPYRAKSYNVRGNQNAVFERSTGNGAEGTDGWALGEEITLPDLRTFMLQSYESFFAQGNLSYGGSLLMTNYFFHLDGAGDGQRIKAYLKALQDGKDGEKSLSLLLDGRTFHALQDDVAKALKRKGIQITFKKETEAGP
jgi:hypothetical protein